MAAPNETYWPVRNFIVGTNEERWRDKSNNGINAESRDALLAKIKEGAGLPAETDDALVVASLNRCGYRPLNNSMGWFLGS